MADSPAATAADELVHLVEELDDLATARAELGSARDTARSRAIRLRDHVRGHVVPRARSLDAPLLVLLLGPTGAGKSSLFNALAGRAASPVGVLRPTTRVAVVLVRPEDRPLVLAEGLPLGAIDPRRLEVHEDRDAPEGLAVVDAPDVDSIAHANRALADQLAEAADLAVFVTTATRYADRAPWDVLERVRDRGLPLVVVVNRMPPERDAAAVVLDDIRRLIVATGLDSVTLGREGAAREPDIVTVTEGDLAPNGKALADSAVEPIRRRIDDLAADREGRRALASRALAGSLGGLGPLVDAVADDLEHEAIDADAVRRIARDAWSHELSTLRTDLARGTFLRAEALRQWQAYVGADEITRFFSTGIGRLRGTISALVRGAPKAPVAEVRDDALADLVALARQHAAEAARRTATSWSDAAETRALVDADPGLWQPSADFGERVSRRLDGWLEAIGDDIRATGKPKKLLARGASVGVNAAGIGVMLATFSHTGGLTGAEVGIAAATGFLNQKLLEALFGEAALAEMIGHARTRLVEDLATTFGEEVARYEDLVPAGDVLRELAADLRDVADRIRRLPASLPDEIVGIPVGDGSAPGWPPAEPGGQAEAAVATDEPIGAEARR